MTAPASPTIVSVTAHRDRLVAKAITNATTATARQAYPIRIPKTASRAIWARRASTGSGILPSLLIARSAPSMALRSCPPGAGAPGGGPARASCPRCSLLAPRRPACITEQPLEPRRQIGQREVGEGDLLVVGQQPRI